jgi:hypothetical protein
VCVYMMSLLSLESVLAFGMGRRRFMTVKTGHLWCNKNVCVFKWVALDCIVTNEYS